MSQTEVDTQILHMCKFIEQEALEKAAEIQDAANEEFNLEKLQLLENEKTNIRKEFSRKENQAEIQKKIEYSKYVNQSRLKVLTAREEAVQETISAARKELIKLSKGPKYQDLMQRLFVQGLNKLGEKSVVVKCREVDKSMIQGMTQKVKQLYQTTYSEACPDIKVDEKDFLNPPPTDSINDPAVTCCGGIKLTSANGKIVLSNTFDDRLMIGFQENLPAIRQKLFG
eukprot:g8301.t1